LLNAASTMEWHPQSRHKKICLEQPSSYYVKNGQTNYVWIRDCSW
jgi:hypothetical protein